MEPVRRRQAAPLATLAGAALLVVGSLLPWDINDTIAGPVAISGLRQSGPGPLILAAVHHGQ